MNNKGFTLIELILVIAILAILAAIALPSYKWGRTRAFNNLAENASMQFRVAQDTYRLHHEMEYATSTDQLPLPANESVNYDWLMAGSCGYIVEVSHSDGDQKFLVSDGQHFANACPCDAGWRNHGEYVSCVSHAADEFLESGCIDAGNRGAVVSTAAQSSCGFSESEHTNNGNGNGNNNGNGNPHA